MSPIKEIQSIEDITELVDAFYAKVREDDLLKDIFNNAIQDRWLQHQETMYKFWQTILLEEHTYSGAPFPPHARLGLEQKHFERWLQLFYATIEERFTGFRATQAIWQGARMAEMFLSRIEANKHNSMAKQ